MSKQESNGTIRPQQLDADPTQQICADPTTGCTQPGTSSTGGSPLAGSLGYIYQGTDSFTSASAAT